MTAPSITQATRTEVDRRLREELAVRLTHGHDAILRRVPDLYRRIIGEALLAEGGATGKAAQLRAAQRALDRVANIGVVDFVDAAGRRWNMQSYVEMAVRTAALRAMIDAQMTVYRQRGITLVYVTSTAGQCELCRPHEATVKAVDAPAPETVLVPQADGTLRAQAVSGTVAEAIAAGLGHPHCRHTLKPFFPGRTFIPPATPDPEGYEAQQQLRALERQIRMWRRREAAAFTPEAKRQAATKVREWQAAAARHTADTTARRDYGREQVERALTSPVPTAPVPRPVPLKAPRDLDDAQLEQGMADALVAEDFEWFGLLGDESDRRDSERQAREDRNARARERRAQRKADEMERQAALLDKLLDEGVDDEEATERAYGITVRDQRRMTARASLRRGGYRGSFDQMARAAYRDRLRDEYNRAEDATNGYLASREGTRRNISTRRLFAGNEQYARKWASPELLEWWDIHGRLTYDGFVAELLGDRGPGARDGDFYR